MPSTNTAPAGWGPASEAATARADAGVVAFGAGWIAVVMLLDRDGGIWLQRGLGLATWVILAVLLRREGPLMRAQVAVVVVLGTAAEYVFSAQLGTYVYRFDNVPAYVPPGHGVLYLCALTLARAWWVFLWRRQLVSLAVVAGGAWAAYGLLLADRRDVVGALWFACFLGFLRLGRSRTFYLAAFALIAYLELLGTGLGVWTYATHDPLASLPMGDPPSGIAGAYGCFDLAALCLGAPVLDAARRVRSRARLRRPAGTATP